MSENNRENAVGKKPLKESLNQISNLAPTSGKKIDKLSLNGVGDLNPKAKGNSTVKAPQEERPQAQDKTESGKDGQSNK